VDQRARLGCGEATGAYATAPVGLVSSNMFLGASPAVNVATGVKACGNSIGGGYSLPASC
jgi:hypothetical protein